MEILKNIITVNLSRVLENSEGNSNDLVFSWQPLQFILSITFCNEDNKFRRQGAALMAAMGESDFTNMWRKLFHTIRIVPVILESFSNNLSSENVKRESFEEKSNWFTFDIPSFRGIQSSVETGGNNTLHFLSNPMAAGKVLTVIGELKGSNIMSRTETNSIASTSTSLSLVGLDVKENSLKEAVPNYMMSEFKFNYTLPDFKEFQGSIIMGFVLFLPFKNISHEILPSSTISTTGGGDNIIINNNNNNNNTNNIMFRAFLPIEERKMDWYQPSSIILGTCHIKLKIGQILQCTSLARKTSSQLRVLINLNINNVTHFPIYVQEASFDIFSTWIGESLGSLSNIPLWSEQRIGPRGSDIKSIELLRKIITITPIVVQEYQLPLILQPEESINFQFSIQVKPHLSHLLASHSLDELYGKFVKGSTYKDLEEKKNIKLNYASKGLSNGIILNSSYDRVSNTISETLISRDELLQILSWSYTSHIYVYYDIITTNFVGNEKDLLLKYKNNNKSLSGLHLRHPVHWSMLPL